ncbi:hypothetical protein DXN05_09925 [Deminuibacter soli]|uniref:Uncharacterized protein n=1 Tax=Deminuibacter soli TaxID=2291815 RepID=A0A3E1NMB1_9BACT|nr:hypothetical protein DXN05_09925 [Deminuibacter soli]
MYLALIFKQPLSLTIFPENFCYILYISEIFNYSPCATFKYLKISVLFQMRISVPIVKWRGDAPQPEFDKKRNWPLEIGSPTFKPTVLKLPI